MPAGAKPFMVGQIQVCWERETTFGTAAPAAAYRPFGTRLGDVRSMGPRTTWSVERGWGGGREGLFLNRVAVDYGGPLAEFKLVDPKVPAFAWGQEPSLPAQIGATSFYRHTVSPSVRHPVDSMSVQFHAEDADAAATRTTYVGGVVNELEVVGGEGAEASFTPTLIFRDEDSAPGKKTVTQPSTGPMRHFHGVMTAYGVEHLRVLEWRFRMLNAATRKRYWNDDFPLLAYEYPFEDVSYAILMRVNADKTTFGSFSNRDWQQLAENGDIGNGVLKMIRTTDQDEATINIGSGNDALAIVNAEMVGPSGGGHVQWDLELIGRVSTYQWVDASSTRFFSL